jgi:hypothetical protein
MPSQTQQTKNTSEDISNRAALIALLEDIKAVEIVARNNYESDIITFQNFIIQETIEGIKKDEDKHIAMLDELIRRLKMNS